MATRDDGQGWIGAGEAARLLRVSRATLYAYVSRGFIRSQAIPGTTRERAYARDDVERLRRQTEERRNPDKAAARALHWGMPILESSIALIDGNKLYYRGHDAVALSRTRSVADVASLIWTGQFDASFIAASPEHGRERVRRAHIRRRADERGLSFVARAQSLLAHAAARDPQAVDLRPDSVARTGWRILHLLTQAAASAPADATATIDQVLARAWGVSTRGVDVLRSALILCADHELNVSSFTARCVASAGSHPYAVVIAGLAALEGPRHGGASARAESMLASLRTPRASRAARSSPSARDLRDAIAERLRRGETIDGFGHPLYRDGDPRGAALMALLHERYARSPELTFVSAAIDAAAAAIGEQPTIDFALAAVARVMRLPPGSPLTLFAIGRAIGWIGHALEQYATGQLIRPRAKYVGVMPAAAPV